MFLREGGRLLLSLRDALERRDPVASERTAQALKGSAAISGAASVASCCTGVIDAVEKGAFEDAGALLQKIDLEMAVLQKASAPSAALERVSAVSQDPPNERFVAPHR